MDKKGFEIQFNWIFVLVAGTAILLFFSGIIIKQKDVSETTTKAAVFEECRFYYCFKQRKRRHNYINRNSIVYNRDKLQQNHIRKKWQNSFPDQLSFHLKN